MFCVFTITQPIQLISVACEEDSGFRKDNLKKNNRNEKFNLQLSIIESL